MPMARGGPPRGGHRLRRDAMSGAALAARILLLWAAGLCAAGQYAKVSVPFAEIAAHYGAAGPMLGWLVSSVGLVGVAFGLAAGILVARAGARRMLLAALAAAAVLSALQAALPPLPVMLASRVAEGAAHLAIVVAAPTLMAALAPRRWQAAAMTLWSGFFGVGVALTAWAGLPLVARAGPGALFAAHAAACAAVALALAATLPRAAAPAAGPRPSALRGHGAIYATPGVAAPALGWLFYTLSFLALLTVIPLRLPDDLRGPTAAALPLASLAVSFTLGAALLQVWPAVRMVMLGFALSALAALALAVLPQPVAPALAMFAGLGLVQAASFAAIPQLNPTEAGRAHANGAIAQAGNLGNLLGTPLLLAVVAAAPATGLPVFALTCFAAGLATHLVFAARRRRAGA